MHFFLLNFLFFSFLFYYSAFIWRSSFARTLLSVGLYNYKYDFSYTTNEKFTNFGAVTLASTHWANYFCAFRAPYNSRIMLPNFFYCCARRPLSYVKVDMLHSFSPINSSVIHLYFFWTHCFDNSFFISPLQTYFNVFVTIDRFSYSTLYNL